MLWLACGRSPAAGYHRRCCPRRGPRLARGSWGSSGAAPPCASPPGPLAPAPQPGAASRGAGVGVRRRQPAAGCGQRGAGCLGLAVLQEAWLRHRRPSAMACLLMGSGGLGGNGHEGCSQVCRLPSHCPDVNQDLAFSPREKGKAHGHTVLGSWAHSRYLAYTCGKKKKLELSTGSPKPVTLQLVLFCLVTN
ncbi:unnamed protein product [Nyctereutes procyonoides]|uniref:(raccoon dog) hypothetical protein n=1 Tax=Nyctereutes procyonoides TaxID=34880 RepID=A0A811YB66_NYCPR|nr:unnamed protein product [Nyctereutes procyonoides]